MKRETSCKLNLACNLTQDELREYGVKMADQVRRRNRATDELEVFKAAKKGEITGFESVIETIAATINAGFEFRDVPCTIVYDFKKGIKRYVRSDTGEIAQELKIEEWERQEELKTPPGDVIQKTTSSKVVEKTPPKKKGGRDKGAASMMKAIERDNKATSAPADDKVDADFEVVESPESAAPAPERVYVSDEMAADIIPSDPVIERNLEERAVANILEQERQALTPDQQRDRDGWQRTVETDATIKRGRTKASREPKILPITPKKKGSPLSRSKKKAARK